MKKYILTALTFLIALFIVGLLLSDSPIIFVKDYLPSFATLLSAFFGAWAAFALQLSRESKKEKENNLAAGNRAMFLFSRFVNELVVLKRDEIDPVKKDPAYFLSMKPLITPRYDDMRFNINQLVFLLKNGEGDLLGKIITEESRFHQAITAIYHRSQIHFLEVQPTLERAKIIQGGNYTIEELKAALGERIFNTIVQATDDAIRHVEETIKSLKEVSTELNKALKRIFPKEKILNFEI
jgi:hypothetical protein